MKGAAQQIDWASSSRQLFSVNDMSELARV